MRLRLLCILILISCSVPKEKSPSKTDIGIALTFILRCKYSGSNPLFANVYYDRYSVDYTQYKQLVLGNSVNDIACNSFTGYKGEGTGCFPVSGNKLPDMEAQLCVLNTINPDIIVVESMGGNDLLSQIPDHEVISRGKSLVDSINRKYPSSTKIFVRVHPTRVDYANEHRTKTNSGISDYAVSVGWKVLDPDSCFQVDSDGRASQSNLLDAIHPNSEAMFCIKNKIKTQYGVSY